MAVWSRKDSVALVNVSRVFGFVDRLRVQQQLSPREMSRLKQVSLEETLYGDIYEGRWRKHDPFKVDFRCEAMAQSEVSFFRGFEGGLFLSSSQPGTLQVLPYLKESVAISRLQGWSEEQDIFLVDTPHLKAGDSVWLHPDLVSPFPNMRPTNNVNVSLRFTNGTRLRNPPVFCT